MATTASARALPEVFHHYWEAWMLVRMLLLRVTLASREARI
jgi:hypothetical protein